MDVKQVLARRAQMRAVLIAVGLFVGSGFLAGSPAVATEVEGPFGGTIWALERNVASVGSYDEEGALFRVAKFKPNGKLASHFGKQGFVAPFGVTRSQAQGIAVDRQGSIIAVGYRLPNQRLGFRNYREALMVKLRPDGTVSRRFGENGTVETGLRARGGVVYRDVDVAQNGRIFVAGSINEARDNGRAALIRSYSPAGEVIKSFGSKGTARIARNGSKGRSGLDDIEILPSGKIVASGFISGRPVVVRLTPSGRLDRSFGNRGIVTSRAKPDLACTSVCRSRTSLSVGPSGRITLVSAPSNRSVFVERFGRSGGRSSSFGAGGVVSISPARLKAAAGTIPHFKRIFDFELGGAAVKPNGSITVVGTSTLVLGGSERRDSATVIALKPNGNLADSFGRRGVVVSAQGLSDAAFAVEGRSAGGVLVGGVTSREVSKGSPDFLTISRYGN